MQLDIVVAFFILGFVAKMVRADIDFPSGLYKGIVIFLLLAIGLKGGVALSSYSNPELLSQSLVVLLLGLLLPLIGFPLLRYIGGLNLENAGSIAAHYGSVSIGTYAVAISFLESQGVYYEPYFPLFVAILEIPAIAVGIWLIKRHSQDLELPRILHEVFMNQGVFLLVGSLLIGWWAGEQANSVMPLFSDIFQGVLAIFLLQMGITAADKFGALKEHGPFIASFAVVMPLMGAALGFAAGSAMQLSVGGLILLATLGASASYIAVPAAMAVAVPKANQSLSITASLAVTFPFNVIVGIPLYAALINGSLV